MLLRLSLSVLAFVLLCSTNVQSQQWPDSKGKDFWLTFLPNFHNTEAEIANDPVLQREHELNIYVGAERPTTGTITWRFADGTITTIPFRIDDVRQLFSTSMYYREAELRGITENGAGFNFVSSDNESVSPKSVHIVSSDDVTVYALNQATTTSDAFLVLPTDATAEDYIVICYPSDIRASANTGTLDFNSTPSQFAVVATQDSTSVDITPSAPTPSNPSRLRQRIFLDKGQSYLVQADLRATGTADLTGSLVRASRPVAIFAGHQRTVLPLALKSQLSSRDCLVEQLNPIRTWGKSAFLTPLAQSSDEALVGSDIYRVVAAFDSTAVVVDGQERTILAAGTFFEDNITTAREVKTSRPALTALYKKTSSLLGQGNFTRVGDPFMMLVPPAEQFMSSYRFINIQSYVYRLNGVNIVAVDSIYTEQWTNVVIPTSGIPSLRLDGVLVNPGLFNQISTTAFSWAQIRMTDGVHEIKADTTFGIYVYGYGIANSYGYIGGMSFRPLDITPPSISGLVSCYDFKGAITDSLIADTRVVSMAVVPGTDVNTIFTTGLFAPPQTIVTFQIALRDLYLDGSISIEAKDAVDQVTRYDIIIPGFTISPVGSRNNPQPLQRAYIVPIGRERCDSFEIENYGAHAHTIATIGFTGTTRITEPVAPFTMASGERRMVRFCRAGTAEQVISDTLLIGDTCVARPILAAQIEEKLDKEGPKIQGNADVCSTEVDVLINDNVGADLGLRSARVLDSVTVNCVISLVDSVELERTYHIEVTDPYLDAIYGFEAIDSADNVNRTIDTIPGFMMAVDGDLSRLTFLDLGIQPVGTLTCDTVTLSNLGIQSITIPRVYVQENIIFSVPQHQFTITVSRLSGTSDLIVCFEPLISDTSVVLTDTIEIWQGCLVRKIAVSGRGKGLAYSGLSRCDVPIDATTGRIVGGVQAIPQPAENDLTLVLDRPTQSVTVHIIDVSGVTVLERSWQGESTRAILLNIAELRPGAYGCRITTDYGTVHTVCVVR
ncbi:MAG: IgGFc-binding protein [Candidatus Kapabacteria bacterium]|nr:IgGFc-binding protein [Candidatus Kapabacteria bacterium]